VNPPFNRLFAFTFFYRTFSRGRFPVFPPFPLFRSWHFRPVFLPHCPILESFFKRCKCYRFLSSWSPTIRVFDSLPPLPFLRNFFWLPLLAPPGFASPSPQRNSCFSLSAVLPDLEEKSTRETPSSSVGRLFLRPSPFGFLLNQIPRCLRCVTIQYLSPPPPPPPPSPPPPWGFCFGFSSFCGCLFTFFRSSDFFPPVFRFRFTASFPCYDSLFLSTISPSPPRCLRIRKSLSRLYHFPLLCSVSHSSQAERSFGLKSPL